MIRQNSDEMKQNAYLQTMMSKSSKDITEIQQSRRECLFQKLPSIDCTQPNTTWQIQKGGSQRCIIDTERLSTAQKPLTPQQSKKQKQKTIQIEENNQFDLGSSRNFQRLFTVKNNVKQSAGSGSVKTQRDETQNTTNGINFVRKSHYHQTFQQSQSSVQQQQCPFQQGQSIKNIITQFMEKKPKKVITRHSEFERMEGLDDYSKEFGKILQEDEIIGPIIGDTHEMKGVVKNLIDLSNGNKLVYHFETLKQLHSDLNITDQMFNRFKYLYTKQLIKMKVNVETVFKCAQTIEFYRGAITSQTRSVQNVKDNIRTIAKNMYATIFDDFSLSPLFKGTKQEEQALKFSRIFGFILGSSESTNYVMDSMRDFHKAFEITSVQYSIFKYYLSGSLSRHTQKEVVWYILEQTDAYKAAVINQDSIKDIVYKQFGIDNFNQEFNRLCQNDPYIYKNFILKVGQEQFLQHTKYFLHYAFNKQNNCFTLDDLNQMHCQHHINLQLYNAIKDKLMNLLQRCNPQRVVFQDFEEEYDLILPYITNQKLPCDIVGEQKICEFVPLIADELKSNVEIKNIFDSNDANINKIILKKFEYLLSGRKYFKRSDIQAIHSRLKISEYVFEEFVFLIEKVIQHYDPTLFWMIEAIKQWKYIIITV